MIQLSQVWHWQLNGLHGIVEMMVGMKKEGMNADQRKRLADARDKLTELLKHLEANAPEKPNGQE